MITVLHEDLEFGKARNRVGFEEKLYICTKIARNIQESRFQTTASLPVPNFLLSYLRSLDK